VFVFARYCGHCGASTSHEIDLRPTDVAEVDVDALPPAAPAAEEAGGAGGEGRSWPRWWPVVTVLVGMAGLGWLLLGSGGAADQNPGGDPSASPLASPSSSALAPADADGGARPGDAGEGATFGTGSEDTSAGPALFVDLPILIVEDQPIAEEGQPVLGRPTGFTLLVGGEDGPLRTLDLDSGTWTTHQAVGTPLLVSGDWLVVSRQADRATHAVPLIDPDGAERALGDASTWPERVSPGPEPGQVWLLVVTVDGLEWRLTALDTGTVTRTVATSEAALVGGGGPSVATSAAAGVFALGTGEPDVGADADRTDGAEDYARVADGKLVGVADDAVLVEQCAAPDRCVYRWLDRSSWRHLDRPVPPLAVDQVVGLSAQGRVLVGDGTTLGRVGLDLVRRRVLPLLVAGPLPFRPVVSPDERYLVTGLVGGVAIIDLDTGARFRVPTGSGSGAGALLIER
jgi:hypothetical protein